MPLAVTFPSLSLIQPVLRIEEETWHPALCWKWPKPRKSNSSICDSWIFPVFGSIPPCPSARPPQAGVKDVSQTVADQIEAELGQQDRQMSFFLPYSRGYSPVDAEGVSPSTLAAQLCVSFQRGSTQDYRWLCRYIVSESCRKWIQTPTITLPQRVRVAQLSI